jgi:HSP20 family protein
MMSVMHWDPFTGMDDAFHRLLSPAGRMVLSDNGTGTRSDWSPSVDISESGSEYLIRAELPAVRNEDVQITYDAGMLTVSGERRHKFEESSEKLRRVKTSYGRFSRSFSLPESVDGGAIKAESKDGIVTIHVPKVKTESRKPIDVRVKAQ